MSGGKMVIIGREKEQDIIGEDMRSRFFALIMQIR